MTKSLDDLNNILFKQLERISCDSLTPKEVETEVKRSRSITDIATQVTTIAGQQLKAVELVAKFGDRHQKNMPFLLENSQAPDSKDEKS